MSRSSSSKPKLRKPDIAGSQYASRIASRMLCGLVDDGGFSARRQRGNDAFKSAIAEIRRRDTDCRKVRGAPTG